MKRRIDLMLVLVCWLAVSTSSLAGFITLNEAELDAIFSQASFGNAPIDVRYGSVVSIISPALASIDSSEDFNALLTQAASHPLRVVNLFFVDEVNWCGTAAPGAVGCSFLSLGIAAVESGVASSAFGAELLAHEIGHTLGLQHRASPPGDGLLGPVLNGDTLLSLSEVALLRNSSLIQTDAQGAYIQVTPIRILSAAVPEPTSVLSTTVVALAWAANIRRRRP